MRLSFVLLAGLCVGSVSAAAQDKKGDRNLITRADILEAGASVTTAYDAVQRLRPMWLRPPAGRSASANMGDMRGSPNATAPIVYINDVRQQALEDLRTLPITRVVQIKYLDQNRGVQMMGPGHEAGAILVVTDEKRTPNEL
jgi:hypothetical protein